MKNLLPLDGRTRLAFLFGDPVTHSLSPAMQNAAFARYGLPCVYAPLQVPKNSVGDAVGMLRSENVMGANVTVPHKEEVMDHLDEIEGDARRLRSVNTIYKRGSRLIGTSTDGAGFVRSLGSEAKHLRGGKALFVGAGGGARSVAGALRHVGVKHLYIMDLDPVRVRALVRFFVAGTRGASAAGVSHAEAANILSEIHLVVQATPVGLHAGDPSPISLQGCRQGTLAVDLIYHRNTEFLIQARRRGLRALDGLGMLLHQGALSFEKWTGKRAPLKVMEAALRRNLKG